MLNVKLSIYCSWYGQSGAEIFSTIVIGDKDTFTKEMHNLLQHSRHVWHGLWQRMTIMMPTLETDHLYLRPFVLADAPEVQRLAGDFAIADTTQNLPHPYEDGMAEAWIATHQGTFSAGVGLILAIVLKSTDTLIGAMSLLDILPGHRAELGYWVGRDFWNQGYCTEAAHSMLQYAFTELDLTRVYARHLSRNPASGRVMQKLGMQHEGTLRKHVQKWQVFEDVEVYGLLREEN